MSRVYITLNYLKRELLSKEYSPEELKAIETALKAIRCAKYGNRAIPSFYYPENKS